MGYSQNVTLAWAGGTRTESAVVSLTQAAEVNISEAVVTASTDYLIACVLDVSEIEIIWIESDQNITLEVNNATTPTPSISLVAGMPYLWYTGCYWVNLLTVDVTALYITNASGATANFVLHCLYDTTP